MSLFGKVSKGITSVVMAMMVVISTFATPVMHVHAQTVDKGTIGYDDLNKWCQRYNQPMTPKGMNVHVSAGSLYKSPYAWRCIYVESMVTPVGIFPMVLKHYDIDTWDICRSRTGDKRAYAKALDDNDPYSWHCYIDYPEDDPGHYAYFRSQYQGNVTFLI